MMLASKRENIKCSLVSTILSGVLFVVKITLADLCIRFIQARSFESSSDYNFRDGMSRNL